MGRTLRIQKANNIYWRQILIFKIDFKDYNPYIPKKQSIQKI